MSSAEILSPEIYKRFKHEFGVEILEGTGSTEICHIFLSNRFGEVKPGSTGKAVPGYHMRLLDDEGEWFVTGDRYLVDEDGFYYFRGRSDDMLRVGGKWLAPGEVEKTIDQHPAVAESAVVGYQDQDDLIKPYAFVVLNPDESASDRVKEDIKQFVKDRIAMYKYPRWIEFTDHIPKTSGGKIQRYVLQDMIKKK